MIRQPKVELQERIKNREREREKIIKMKSMMWLNAYVLQTNINDKYGKFFFFGTLNHDHNRFGVDHDFSSTTIHKSHIIGNQDHQKIILKK